MPTISMHKVHLVSCYRRIVDEGLSRMTRVDRFEVSIATTGQDTAFAAIDKFKRKHDVDDWRELADRYRIRAAF